MGLQHIERENCYLLGRVVLWVKSGSKEANSLLFIYSFCASMVTFKICATTFLAAFCCQSSIIFSCLTHGRQSDVASTTGSVSFQLFSFCMFDSMAHALLPPVFFLILPLPEAQYIVHILRLFNFKWSMNLYLTTQRMHSCNCKNVHFIILHKASHYIATHPWSVYFAIED